MNKPALSQLIAGMMLIICLLAFTTAAARAESGAWTDLDPVQDNLIDPLNPLSPVLLPFPPLTPLPQPVQKTSQPTSAQHNPYLPRTATGMPIPFTNIAPANLSLRAVGQFSLPATKMDSLVKESGMREDIYGGEGNIQNTVYSAIGTGITGESAFGLTTGHQSDTPQVSSFPTMPSP
ncbi:MAG: hypothetical protein K2X27_01260 [Candidatus Obscuribacterales bacterium]|nr:hypothetical protein [Candidatus Obscuribacterales bacterium]